MRIHQTEVTTPIAHHILREAFDPSILIVDGYGVKIVIRKKNLFIEDGIQSGKRVRIIYRADRIRRIVILTDDGYVSLNALKWMQSEGICIAQYSHDGKLIFSSSPSNDSPHIRLAQCVVSAGAMESTRLDIVKSFLTAKLNGQASIAASDIFHREDIANDIARQLQYLDKATTIQELLGHEGKSAQLYWSMWTNTISISWSSTRNLPNHWVMPFQGRASGTKYNTPPDRYNRNLSEPITGNRNATDPINAILNYAYSIAMSECINASHIYGLDPAIGFQHSIGSSRQALALDLLEIARPMCDQIVLDIISSTKFKLDYCYESQHGIVRLSPPLTHRISEHCLDMARIIQPHVSNLVCELGALRLWKLSE